VLAFRLIIIQITKTSSQDPGLDPWKSSITIASLCHLIYRRNMMPSKSIAIIPENGFIPNNSSIKCAQWLKFVSERDNIFIQHANNGGEYQCGPFFLDGICHQNMTIYEFHGCMYHGCPKCFSPETFNSLKQLTMKSVNGRHNKRMTKIRELMPSFKIEEIWECEFNKTILNQIEIAERLKPREALFGGRTNAFKLYYKCKAGEKIKYQDYTSLYPDIQKNGVFPIGHPVIITENFGNIADYFGLIKCEILPPRGMLFKKSAEFEANF
jgi:hypothetical protein